MTFRKFFPNLALTGLVLLAVSPRGLAQTPILQYDFNGGAGNSATSTGSDTTEITFYNAGTASNLYSADGAGVSGRPGDFAFNNAASDGMGKDSKTGGAAETSQLSSLASLTSFTLTGWFKTDGTKIIGNSAQLINYGGLRGFTLYTVAAGYLDLSIEGVEVTSNAAYIEPGRWTFFAVTYDGTLASNNVNFYIGTTTSDITLVNTRTLNKKITPNLNTSLILGNNSIEAGAHDPMDGLLDDIKIYGALSGSSGVLSQSAIESIRKADVSGPAAP